MRDFPISIIMILVRDSFRTYFLTISMLECHYLYSLPSGCIVVTSLWPREIKYLKNESITFLHFRCTTYPVGTIWPYIFVTWNQILNFTDIRHFVNMHDFLISLEHRWLELTAAAWFVPSNFRNPTEFPGGPIENQGESRGHRLGYLYVLVCLLSYLELKTKMNYISLE